MTAAARPSVRGDDGAAIVEFCYLGLLLLIPLVYAMITVFSAQAAAYAVTSAAREAGRAVSVAPDATDLEDRAFEAARIAAKNHGFELPDGSVDIACVPSPCSSGPDVRVDIRVQLQVPLPGVPGLAGESLASWKAIGLHSQQLPRYAERPR